MPKLCNIDIENSEEIYDKLKRFVKRLRADYEIRDIYLYGSFLHGDIHEGSDIDLLIVGNFKGRFVERISAVLKLTDLPIEPLVYTPEEFDRMKNENSFIKESIGNGKRI